AAVDTRWGKDVEADNRGGQRPEAGDRQGGIGLWRQARGRRQRWFPFVREHPRRPEDGQGRARVSRHRRRARLDRRPRGQRARVAALPEEGDEGAVPEVWPRRVLLPVRVLSAPVRAPT